MKNVNCRKENRHIIRALLISNFRVKILVVVYAQFFGSTRLLVKVLYIIIIKQLGCAMQTVVFVKTNKSA